MMRVQADHWAVIEIITNKLVGPSGRENLARKWAELTVFLNGLGLGEKTTEGWKKTLIDWKSKTKAKAAAISKYVVGTGGGPPGMTLTSFEERLVNIMGKTAIQGDNVTEIGIKRPCESQQPVEKRPRYITICKNSCEQFQEQQGSKIVVIDNDTLSPATSIRPNQVPVLLNISKPNILRNSNFPIKDQQMEETVSKFYSVNSQKDNQSPKQAITTRDFKQPMLLSTPKNFPFASLNIGQIDATARTEQFTSPVSSLDDNKNEQNYEQHDINKSKIETVIDNTEVSKSFGLRRPVASRSGQPANYARTPKSQKRHRETSSTIRQEMHAMNDSVLAVLNNINNNVLNISVHLGELVQVIKNCK